MIIDIFLRKILNKVTMYRLMVYFLLLLLGLLLGLNHFEFLIYKNTSVLWTTVYLLIFCNTVNFIFAKLLNAKSNFESASITAIILSLVMGPYPPFQELIFLSIVGVSAIASKYLITFKLRHVFNPAVLAIFVAGTFFNNGASWWAETTHTVPFLIIGGLLAAIKARRQYILYSFLLIYFVLEIFLHETRLPLIFAPSIWFFALVMLIEPLTSPSDKKLQIGFGAYVALSIFVLRELVPGYPNRLEAALLTANILFFILHKPATTGLRLKSKEKVAENTWSFNFEPEKKPDFNPGQYIEITAPHSNPDARGQRRFFTIASSPTEELISLAMRLPEKHSTFKDNLFKSDTGDKVITSGPHGDFVLPRDTTIPLGFIAGGIGVTPFRSMIKCLLDTGERRDIVFLYSNNTEEDVAFKEIFDNAKRIGIKTIYVITNKEGFIDKKKIEESIPDYGKRVFYISGANTMVDTCVGILKKMKVQGIKTDYFPGY